MQVMGLNISTADHALMISKDSNKVLIIRPALSWDGRTGLPAKIFGETTELPWFQWTTKASKTKIWKLFSIPFLTFAIVSNS